VIPPPVNEQTNEQAQATPFSQFDGFEGQGAGAGPAQTLKLSPDQFAVVVRKAGNSISAITKEAGR
jgi:hypothetical protein